MEKVIHINIGNYTFTIEEPAYEKLKAYLELLSRHFAQTEGKEEIIGDIEIRIGELLQRKISESKKVINDADINEVLEQMGNPSDIGEGSNDSAQDKTDTGQQYYYPNRRRRIFRDPDNKKVGGVCGGIAAYFDMDPLWLRLSFVLLVVFAGTGVLLYIILWAILPEALTAAEKLEMRGEPVDVNNIERTIKENMHRMKKDFKNYYEHEGKSDLKKGKMAASSFAAELFHQVGHIILRIVGGFLLFLGILLSVVWFKTMMFSNSNGISGFISHLFSENWQQQMAVIGMLVLVAVPILSLCFGGFQLLFGMKVRNRALRYSFSTISSIAFIALVYLGYVTFENFSTSGNVQTFKSLSVDSTKTIQVTFERDDVFEDEDKITPTQNSLFYQNGNEMRTGQIKIYIRKSDRDSSYIEQRILARGIDAMDARLHAKRSKYDLQQINNKIILPNYLSYPKNNSWRNQKLELTIYLTKGTKLDWNGLPPNIHLEPEFNGTESEEDFYDHNCKNWEMGDKGIYCIGNGRSL